MRSRLASKFVHPVLLLCMGMFAAPVSVRAADLFTSPYRGYVMETANGAGIVKVVGDVNGDLKLDLVSTPGYRLGTGIGTMGSLVPFPASFAGALYEPMKVADMDHDGFGDVVVRGQIGGQSRLCLRRGSPSGPGAELFFYRLGSSHGGIDAHDMNLDGNPDVVVANTWDSLKVLLGNGGGGVMDSTKVITGINPVDMAVGDFDRNGIPDVAVLTSRYGQAGYVSVHLGLGGGVLGPRKDFPCLSEALEDIVAADVNGDGLLDVIASGNTIGSVFLGFGDGTFDAASPLSGTGARLCSGDFNGDGLTDLAHCTTYNANRIAVEWQMPSGSRGTQEIYRSEFSYFTALTTADLDGDGRSDLIASIGGMAWIFSALGIPPMYVMGNGTAGHSLIDLADLDGDARPEYIGLGYWIASALSTGFFAPADSFGSDPTKIAMSTELGDVNGDGRSDLVVTRRNNCPYPCNAAAAGIVFLGDGAGGFGPGVELVKLRSSNVLRIGDVNGDGYGDIVTRFSSPTSGYPVISVILGGPAGPSDEEVQTEVPGVYVGAFGLADVNGDGRADFAAHNQTLIANPDGTFGVQVLYPTGFSGRAVLADFDADGIRDLVLLTHVGASSVQQVKVGRGRGDGSFESRFSFDYPYSNSFPGTGEYSDLIRVADFDGDGRLDIMFDDYIGSTFLLGRANFSFEPTAILGVHGLPADVDLDGRLDLVRQGWTYFNGARSVVSVSPMVGSSRLTLELAGPNPATTLLTVRIAPLAEPAQLELWDITGRRVRALEVRTSRVSQTASLVAVGLAPGAYIIALRGADRTLTRRVTIVR